MKCGNCGSTVPDGLAICNICKKPVITTTSDSDTVMCPCCGESNFKGIKICSKCGSALAVPREARAPKAAAHARKKKRRLNPKFVAAVVIFVLISAVSLSVLLFLTHRKDDLHIGKLQSFYSASDGYTQFVFDGEALAKTDGSVVLSASSLDDSARAVLTDSGKLCHISPSGKEEVSSNVVFCSISANGAAIPYLVDIDNGEPASETQESQTENDGGEETNAASLYDKSELSLFLYDCADKTSTLIANNVNSNSVAISPDGNSVSYTIASSDSKSFEGYICSKGIYSSAGKGVCIAALSDNADYVYYLKYESGIDSETIKFFAKSSEKEIKLGELGDASGLSLFLNKKASEVIFSLNGSGGNYFVSVGCDEKKRVSTGFKPVLPYGKQALSFSVTGSAVSLCPVDTFAGVPFNDASETLVYIDSSFNSIEVSGGVSNARVSSKGDLLFYIDDNDFLYSYTVKSPSDKKKLASHVGKFEISPDGARCFYMDGDDALYCCTDENTALIGSDVSDIRISLDGTVYFLENFTYGSGKLYYSKSGTEKTAVSGADNVSSVIMDCSDKLYYRSDHSTVSGTFDLWYGSENSFVMLFDDFG